MSERYSRLYTAPTTLYTAGSPVVIAAGALLKDNQTGGVLAQLKFTNRGKKIKALKVSLEAFDVEGKPLEGVAEYQYLDFDAARDADFGQKQAIPMPDAVTRSFRCRCTGVIFSDGTIWNAPADAVWEPIPEPVAPADYLGDLAGQYIRDVGSAKMIPVAIGDLWRCTCGALNGAGEEKCHKCANDKAHLFSCLEKAGLEERKATYDAEQARLAEEARLQEEKRHIFAERKRRKRKRVIVLLACLIVVVGGGSFLGLEGCYLYADKCYQEKNFEEANYYFRAIEFYRDSNERIHDGHTYVCETIPATCTAKGTKRYTCKCGDTYTTLINVLPHTWDGADCHGVRSCAICKATDGGILGHTGKDECTRCTAFFETLRYERNNSDTKQFVAPSSGQYRIVLVPKLSNAWGFDVDVHICVYTDYKSFSEKCIGSGYETISRTGAFSIKVKLEKDQRYTIDTKSNGQYQVEIWGVDRK